jgi:hypothetical protein
MPYDITAEDLRLQELGRRYWRGSGWYALGRGGSALAREHISWLTELGYQPVGHGRPPAGAEIVYGPTGTRSPGGPGRRIRHYVGRWTRP